MKEEMLEKFKNLSEEEKWELIEKIRDIIYGSDKSQQQKQAALCRDLI